MMTLHKDKNAFRDLIQLTSKKLNISDIYIEKDYWVVYILHLLSNSKYSKNIVFKGGTSLSKAYNLIKRFSEDIDLQLLNFNGNDNQKKKFIKKIEKEITQDLDYLKDHPRESKHGNIRKTIYNYDKETDNDVFFQASKEIVLEINAMSTPDPYEIKKIRTYIADFLLLENKKEFINEYGLNDIEVYVLNKNRTFIEKIFALLDYSFLDNYIEELSKKIRHLYDVYMLIMNKEVYNFFNSDQFYYMANRVVIENDFYNKRKDTIYTKSVLFNIDELNKLERNYKNDFSAFLFGDLPEFDNVKIEFSKILKKIEYWEINYRNI